MSRRSIDVDVSTIGSASHAERLRAEVGRESPDEGAVEMPEAQDAAAAYAGTAFEQVHSAAALIAVGGQVRVPEDPEFRHGMGEATRAAGASARGVRRLAAGIIPTGAPRFESVNGTDY
jgi:hypothetical protein